MSQVQLSVIIPVRNEASSIQPLFAELEPVLERLGFSWEVLFIDDASTDQTEQEIRKLQRDGAPPAIGEARPKGGRVVCIKFSRHYGQSAALACGIDEAKGDILITMDGDLQNDPADIGGLLKKLNEGFDVVCGWRKDRKDNPLRIAVSRLANSLIRRIIPCPIHDHGCTLRAYRHRLFSQEGMQVMGDMHRLLPAYLAWLGARVAELPVNHRPRRQDRSKYTILARSWKVLLDVFVLNFYFSYLTRPMHFFGSISLGLVGGAFIMEAFVVFRRLTLGGEWMSPLFFLGLFLLAGALVFLFLGVIADLLTRNFMVAHKLKPYHLAAKDTYAQE